MSALPPERRVAKFLGLFSFGLGIAQLAVPDRVNDLIGVRDTPKTRAVQRAIGVQELSAAQGIAALSPPTPVLWTRVAGDVLHAGLLARALQSRRNDKTKLYGALGAVGAIGLIDLIVSVRYQSSWPKEPTPGESLPNRSTHDEELDAHVGGHPAITILASEA